MKVEVDPRATDLDEQVLACRARGHAWQEVSVEPVGPVVRGRFKEIVFVDLCGTCDSERRLVKDVTNWRAGTSKRRYVYSDRFKLNPSSDGPLHRGDAFAALMVLRHPEYFQR